MQKGLRVGVILSLVNLELFEFNSDKTQLKLKIITSVLGQSLNRLGKPVNNLIIFFWMGKPRTLLLYFCYLSMVSWYGGNCILRAIFQNNPSSNFKIDLQVEKSLPKYITSDGF